MKTIMTAFFSLSLRMKSCICREFFLVEGTLISETNSAHEEDFRRNTASAEERRHARAPAATQMFL